MSSSSTPKISACIITKNEEGQIKRCLQSIAWADEIIVIDSGSTDRTVEIAQELGAKTIHHDWPGWAKQKNYCLDQASHDWILSLDADEWLEPEAENSIRQAVENKEIDSYRLSRKTFFLGRWIAHSGWYPDKQVRLFQKSKTCFEEVPVHEKVTETASTTDLPLDILHESYTSLEQYMEKSNAYSTAQAKQQAGQSHLMLKLILKPWYRFFQTYLWQKGFLDGREGFILAVSRMYYDFLIIAKIIHSIK